MENEVENTVENTQDDNNAIKSMRERIKELEKKTRFLNHEVQNVKLQASSRVQRGVSYSQLPCTQHP